MKFHKDGTLPQNGEVFVFGSNLAGIHGAGAAKVAKQKFGAIQGVGTGLNGQSFAIPTKSVKIETLPLAIIYLYVCDFIDATHANPHLSWFVTRVGCGLAGYKNSDIAGMFKEATNCSFAEEWRKFF